MLPSYRPGDHVLTYNWGKIGKGDVVVFRAPPGHFIKRVDKYVDPSIRKLTQGKHYNKVYNYVYVSGDNKRQSAKVKPIKAARIVGKVILKY